MEPILILALFGISALMISSGGDDDMAEPENAQDEEMEVVPVDTVMDDADETGAVLIDPETGAFLVGPGQTAIGTEGDDLFQGIEGVDYSEDGSAISISAGEGDDIVDFGAAQQEDDARSTRPIAVMGSHIDGGAGNDTIDIPVNASTVTGGDGDDVIQTSSYNSTFEGGDGNDILSTDDTPYNSTVYGGSGDDVIENAYSCGSHLYGDDGNDTIVTGHTTPDERTYAYGGDGDDLLDVREAQGGFFYGGDGDDTILTSEGGAEGLDFGTDQVVDGGAGDDLFIHQTPQNDVGGDAVKLVGGEGTDSYQVTLHEGFGYNSGGTVVQLADFVPGEETIQIDLEVADPAYAVASAQLVPYHGSTDLVITYEHATEDPILMTVTINANGVTWDDITFVGDNIPPELEVYEPAQTLAENEDRPDPVFANIPQTDLGDEVVAPDGPRSVTILGSDGDDEIDFWRSFGTVSGGDGNDVIGVDAEGATVLGGSGNDTISSDSIVIGSTITGDDGDDKISIEWGYNNDVFGGAGDDRIIIPAGENYDGYLVVGEEPTFVYGGAGDDVIDADSATEAYLYGGAGADTIFLNTEHVAASGGDGDDTLILENADAATAPVLMTGGDGVDSFEISLLEGYGEDNQSAVATLGDFETGVDTLEVTASTIDDGFDVTSASLAEDTATGVTRLTVTFESDTEADREIHIDINATDVTWDDITFVGDNIPPLLVPLI